jgi:hypothetical protein
MPFNVQDALLSVSIALPNGANTVNSPVIDLGSNEGIPESAAPTSEQDYLIRGELLISAPALTASQLPNSQTMTYSVQMCASSGFGSGVQTYSTPLVQTGAASAGAAAATARVRPASNALRYWRLSVVNSGSGNASGVSGTMTPVF